MGKKEAAQSPKKKAVALAMIEPGSIQAQTRAANTVIKTPS